MGRQSGPNPPELPPSRGGNFFSASGDSLIALYQRGSASFFNISVYAFGLSGMWTGVGSVVLQFKVLDIIDQSPPDLFGWKLDKIETLALISLVGLAAAAFVQPLSGSLSDQGRLHRGRRLPWILVGSLGMAGLAFWLGAVEAFIPLLAVSIAMQIAGNMGQGPANALIIDHVPEGQRGVASGALNLSRVAGAGVVTLFVLWFMGNYDRETAPQWMWYSIILMATVLLITTLYTTLSLMPKRRSLTEARARRQPRSRKDDDEPGAGTGTVQRRDKKRYYTFLASLAFVIAAMSSMQIYALFFLQDVVGLENPARGADMLLVVVVAGTALTVLPAGRLADRFGKDRLLMFAGVLGAVTALSLLFVNSLAAVLIDGLVIGVTIGLFLTLTWTAANDLVGSKTAARDLGLTSLATLVGATIARGAGFGIGALNEQSENLGYQVMLVGIAAAFIISSQMLARITRRPLFITEPPQAQPSPASEASGG